MTKRILSAFAIAMFAAAAWAQTPQIPDPPTAPQEEAPQRVIRGRRVHVDAPSPGSYLGVDPRDVTSERVAALNLKADRGVEVMMVDGDSPAGKAGVKEHDVILAFNGKQVSNVDQLRRMLRETQPGRTVPLAISRAGQAMTLKVTLAKRPEEAMFSIPPIPPMPPIDVEVPSIIVLQSSARNGALVEDLTPQLADFFGVKNGQGVLVRSVERGSPAASAGLKAGDVIVKVANEPITCSSDWGHMMRGRNGAVPLAVVRDKREQSVTIKLPDKGSDSSLHIEIPNLDKQMKDLRAEMETLRPQMEEQIEMARAQVHNEMMAHHSEIEQAMKLRRQDWERVQRETRKAMQQAMDELKWK